MHKGIKLSFRIWAIAEYLGPYFHNTLDDLNSPLMRGIISHSAKCENCKRFVEYHRPYLLADGTSVFLYRIRPKSPSCIKGIEIIRAHFKQHYDLPTNYTLAYLPQHCKEIVERMIHERASRNF